MSNLPSLDKAIRKQVPSVPAAIAALVRMERDLAAAKTYEDIRKVIREAEAINVLLGHVAEVKAQAEDTIIVANRRIGEEIETVPKATHKGGPKKQITKPGKSLGRGALGIPGTSRARLKVLVKTPVVVLKSAGQKLRAAGKDATVAAVVREITQGDKKTARATREKALGSRQRALPQKKYGVILADPEWHFEPYSEETGMDRAADNHYPTSSLEVIVARDVPSIAADDCVLWLWGTVPMFPQALTVMEQWGFVYKSHFIWRKPRIGTGYWNRNVHELLLIGTRGKVPAPAPGTQFESVIDAPTGRHSEKPERFYEIIEAYFPTLPKIELNRRGPARPGWDAWGNEAEAAA